jgi:putative SOS response-associated peptidase YedK
MPNRYQELVLSHRCLVFADGMAFWLCRERMFSEDTFLDEYPSDEILFNGYLVTSTIL